MGLSLKTAGTLILFSLIVSLTICSIALERIFDLENHHHDIVVDISFDMIKVDIPLISLSFISFPISNCRLVQ